MKVPRIVLLAACVLILPLSAQAKSIQVTMNAVDTQGVGQSVGSIEIAESEYGVVFTPDLQGLTPGLHGFHLHQNPSCASGEKSGKQVAGLAAGGHFDPLQTGRHGAPWGDGHLGDLPALYVDSTGKSTMPVLAPRLKISDLQQRSLMIHAGGDNYSDHPHKLGGGGARMACGVVN